ncbi:hypothetical protein DPMN_153983 [Dreissena polymorpha]|uniref:5'-3' exoribonuclease 1 SH3-like domain-containing protein n=1 Tax=Dreissena polymorpha TaxID=45954 RepID=A0A9D4FKA7_DREPO|nr:hypothetical protein DPMN_153983 [Dreissena polymorpha]
MITSGALIPDSSATYELFDRVVNTRQGFTVPFGLRGTVVGIYLAEVEVNIMYDVLFDEDFAGGIAIRYNTILFVQNILNLTLKKIIPWHHLIIR